MTFDKFGNTSEYPTSLPFKFGEEALAVLSTVPKEFLEGAEYRISPSRNDPYELQVWANEHTHCRLTIRPVAEDYEVADEHLTLWGVYVWVHYVWVEDNIIRDATYSEEMSDDYIERFGLTISPWFRDRLLEGLERGRYNT